MWAALLPYVDVLLVILGIIIAGLVVWIIRTEMRLRKFMVGKNAQSLEDSIAHIQKRHEEIEKAHEELKAGLKHVHKRLGTAVRGVSAVRFNAFDGRGESGAQSFAMALLSEDGDGAVVSSLHARENTRVYAKPLTEFSSKHELTEEEKRAIVDARKRIDSK